MISVCMLTKNAEKTLLKTLDSARAFPIIVLDTGSTDETLSILQNNPNTTIFQSPFKGFGRLRNELAEKAPTDWILALDSDEVISPSLLEEIQALSLDPSCVYSIPRHNFYRGKQIKGCGWHPERVCRLYHRKQTQYTDAPVHESLIATKEIKLHSPLLHTPYRSVSDFLEKMQHYSTLFAEQYQGKRTSSFAKATLCGAFSFFRSYFLRRGFLDGKEGFEISFYNGSTTFYKYLKLMEKNKMKR